MRSSILNGEWGEEVRERGRKGHGVRENRMHRDERMCKRVSVRQERGKEWDGVSRHRRRPPSRMIRHPFSLLQRPPALLLWLLILSTVHARCGVEVQGEEGMETEENGGGKGVGEWAGGGKREREWARVRVKGESKRAGQGERRKE